MKDKDICPYCGTEISIESTWINEETNSLYCICGKEIQEGYKIDDN